MPSKMADVNNANVADEIGLVSVEGFNNQFSFQHSTREYCASVYLGETLKYDVVIKKLVDADSDFWKRHISTILTQASISNSPTNLKEQLERAPSQSTDDSISSCKIVEDADSSNGLLCPVLATFFGAGGTVSSSEKDNSCRPYFRGDDTYVIPMSSSLQDVSGDCSFVELRISLCLYTVSVLTSGKSPEVEDKQQDSSEDRKEEPKECKVKKKIRVDVKDFFDNDDEDEDDSEEDKEADRSEGQISIDLSPVRVSSSSRTVQEKTVITRLKVQGPPELRMRHSPAGHKQLILLSVSNSTEKQMVIKSIQMLSSSTPVHDVSLLYEDGASIKWESCHQLINLECPKRHHAFPVILSPCEELNLVYRLYLSSVPSDSELSLRANVKWTHAGASNEITTVYKLPRIKIRCPPFIVTVKCDEEVELGKTFCVTYSISNQLHDFMSMRLYYNLDNMCKALSEKGGTEEEFKRVQHLKDSIVCHDPDIAINSCPRGTCVPIRVGFQIHKPGLYELSELMKVNLRYSFPETNLSPHPDDRESRSTSTDTTMSCQSTDDHLLASEELWRGRSGSTASLATPIMFQTAEERRRSFASKSYSFGDLGPTVSADSEETGNNRNKIFKRSTAVPPPRPPPPRLLSQTERDLIRPSNFLKQPFYIYVKDPQMM